MQRYQKTGWVQSGSEMLGGLLGGINALVAMGFVIMARAQAQYQSGLLCQIPDQQKRQTEILEAHNRMMREET